MDITANHSEIKTGWVKYYNPQRNFGFAEVEICEGVFSDIFFHLANGRKFNKKNDGIVFNGQTIKKPPRKDDTILLIVIEATKGLMAKVWGYQNDFRKTKALPCYRIIQHDTFPQRNTPPKCLWEGTCLADLHEKYPEGTVRDHFRPDRLGKIQAVEKLTDSGWIHCRYPRW